MGKQRRGILTKLAFANIVFTNLLKYEDSEVYHPTFAWLADECDTLMTKFLQNDLKSPKRVSQAVGDALYADATVSYAQRNTKPLQTDKDDSNEHPSVFLISLAVVFLDDVWCESSKKMRKIVSPVVSNASKIEIALDEQGKMNGVRDEAVQFAENIYEKIEEYRP